MQSDDVMRGDVSRRDTGPADMSRGITEHSKILKTINKQQLLFLINDSFIQNLVKQNDRVFCIIFLD